MKVIDLVYEEGYMREFPLSESQRSAQLGSLLVRMEEELGRDRMFDYESEIVSYAATCERDGFMSGFRYAVNLFLEVREMLSRGND